MHIYKYRPVIFYAYYHIHPAHTPITEHHYSLIELQICRRGKPMFINRKNPRKVCIFGLF
jgi:hypothetical protein